MNYFVLLIVLCSSLASSAQTVDDTLIGVVDGQLIKINKNTGGIINYLPVVGMPVGSDHIKLTWCEPNQCFYTLSQSYPPILAKIDMNGIYSQLGSVTFFPGFLYMCEGLSYNRFDGELYASGSLNGDPNSSPADYSSEVLLRIDTTTLTTILVGTFNNLTPTISEADGIAFDDNGILYMYDGQPGQFDRFFMQDLTFSSPSTLVYNSPYNASRGLTVKGNEMFFSQNRVLKKINTTSFLFSNVGTMFTAADFNGQFLRGITWKTGCISPDLFGNDTTICSGQSFLLAPSVTGTSYLWQDGSTNSSFNVSVGGSYSVEVTDGNCTFIDSIFVTVETAPIVDLGNDSTLCIGQTYFLNAPNTNGTVTWQDGSNGTSFLVNQAGVYWASSTNQCGTVVDSVTISYTPQIDVNLGDDSTICAGNSILLDATVGANSYLWQDGSTNATYNATLAGLYWVEASLDGCTNYDSIEVFIEDELNIDLGPDQIICFGETILLSVEISNAPILWGNGSPESSIVTTGDGWYWVEAYDQCGVESDSILVMSEECYCLLYVPNSFTPNQDERNNRFGPIYDCPISDYTFEIYNRWGERIFETTDQNLHWDGTFKGRPVQDGLYTYKIIYSSEDLSGNVIVGHVSVIR